MFKQQRVLLNRTWAIYSDDSVQGCSISIANALEILQSCTKPSIYLLLHICNVDMRYTLPQLRPRALLKSVKPWWRHQMETFSALLALCAGNSPVTGEFPSQRPVTRGFDVFVDLRLDKRLSKQSNNREAGDLRRHRGHYDVIVINWYLFRP